MLMLSHLFVFGFMQNLKWNWALFEVFISWRFQFHCVRVLNTGQRLDFLFLELLDVHLNAGLPRFDIDVN